MDSFNKNFVVVSLVLSFMFGFFGINTVFASNGEAVDLGAAGNFVILAKTGVSTTGTTSIVGNVGLSPAAASYITGFDLTLPAASAFSTSALVVGKIYAPGYADPTPTDLTTAVLNMQTAYTSAMGRAPSIAELGAGIIGGLTLAPGVYKWESGVTIPTNVTLSGSANDVWIFQIAQNLEISSATQIILSGGAQPSNIFWVVAGQTTIGTTAVFNGNILDQTTIVLNTGAVLNGRALAQTAVTMDSNSVVVPVHSAANLDSSASFTATIAQSETPITITIAPGVTMTTMSTGCSGGNTYNTSTGAQCINNSNISQGCGGNNKYNISTGALCMMNNSSNTNKYNFGSTNLKNGDHNNAVIELQRFMNANFNSSLIEDGKFGPNTITAIKKWQRENSLSADGVVGAKTKAKMYMMALQ